jgi:IMP dehydrogenase
MNNPQIQALDDKNYLDADTFFTKNPWIALTYGDFSLATHYSEILPRDTDTTSQLTEKIQLSTPIISADMDTVTESNMAIQMALNGGLWIIHSNLSPEEQSKEVAKVKHHVHGIIRNPITISPDKLIWDILQLKYNFSTFPVLDNSGKLLGLLWGESIKERFQNLRVQEAMIKKEKVHHILESELWEDPINTADIFFTDNRGINKLLVIDKEWNLKWLITESDVSRIKKEANSDIKPSRDDEHRLRVWVTLHMIRDANWELDRNKIIEQVEKLVKKGVDIVAISTAHGNSKWVGDMIKIIRQNFKDLDIIAWNVTSAKWVEFLKEMWANVVKVGQWPWSICSTRVVAWVGIPQMTALYICSKAAKILWWITTIADWGITTSWDMVKALTLWDSVMIWWLLAWSDESPWDKVEINGTLYKVYRGMWSKEAMQKGSAARYGHSLTKDTSVKVAAEWISGLKEWIWPVAQTIREFRAGIQSGMWYHGAKNLQELQKIARYVWVTQAWQTEARPHDVLEIKVK